MIMQLCAYGNKGVHSSETARSWDTLGSSKPEHQAGRRQKRDECGRGIVFLVQGNGAGDFPLQGGRRIQSGCAAAISPLARKYSCGAASSPCFCLVLKDLGNVLRTSVSGHKVDASAF